MAVDEGERKLAAILAADVAGYSRLMGDDERATVASLKVSREIFRDRIEAHSGRLIDTAGDSVLAEFKSVVEAVQCAVEVQDRLGTDNIPVPEHRKMQFRIGINLGDIIEEDDGTIYGEGVNVAARLESLAAPGGVMVSEDAYRQVRAKMTTGFEDAGEHEVKNIAEPVRAYKVLAEGEAAPTAHAETRRRFTRPVATIAVVGIIAGIIAWHFLSGPADDRGGISEVTEVEGVLPPLPTGPAIAVLPFDNLGEDPEQEYFADGLAEDVLTRLSAFRDLKVIARNSSFQYKGEAVDIRAVGRELGADFVLEGSVRRDADSIRVSAQLLDAKEDGHVWAESYDRDLSAGSIFAIQDEITQQVVAAIGGTTGAIATSRLRQSLQSSDTDDLRSYECVLLAQRYTIVGTSESHLAARTCLIDVLAREPNYVEALAWLGQIYIEEIWTGFNSRNAGLSSVEAAFEVLGRALELDPNHQLARKALALAYYYDRNAEQFIHEAQKAVALNPNDAHTLTEMAQLNGYAGNWEESKLLTKRLRSLVSEVLIWHHFTEFNYHYRDKNYAAAAASGRAALEYPHWAAPWYLALAYAGMGENDKAMAALAKARALEPELTTEVVRKSRGALFLDEVHLALLMEGHARLLEIEESLAPSRPVIAVLPFDNMSGDPEQEYFADGITEDIITRLAQYPDILVLGRNTTFQFKGEAVDIPTIAEKLKADYVVEGSIRRDGDTVRVTAQLLGGDGGTHVWAETYDRSLTPSNLFAIQDEITGAVANRIADKHGAISIAEAAQAPWQTPDQLSSYECVLRFHEYERAWNPQAHMRVRSCLEAVVDREPDYGVAFAYLAHILNSEIFIPMNPRPNSSLRNGLEMAEQGVRLDPTNGHTHVFLAYSLLLTDDPDRAVREADEALRLSPNSALVIGNAALVHLNTGGYGRTKELMDRLTVLNPNYPLWMNWNIAKLHLVRHEYLEAVTWLERAGSDTWHWTHAYIAAALCANGEIERGQASVEKALKIQPNLAEVYWPETHMWFKGDGVYPLMSIVGDGLEVCGWDVPPDPGPEAFAQ